MEETIYLLSEVSEVAVFGVAGSALDRGGRRRRGSEAVRLTDTEGPSSPTAGRGWPATTPEHVVVLDSLPKNPSGKLLKRDLRERYADLAQAPRG